MSIFVIWDKITPIIEILILWVMFYHILVFIIGTRSFQVLKGLIYLVLAFIFFQYAGFNTLIWLLTKFFALSVIAFMIIFQQELRQGLAHLGQQHLFRIALEEAELMVVLEGISTAVFKLARGRIGCLIAIERETKLNTYIESGVAMDAKISPELLQSIFSTASPLHDGGVVTRGDRLIAASCLFPLSDNHSFRELIGTRHRAALGLSEQTDALAVLASEETGDVTIAIAGKFIDIPNEEKLVAILKSHLLVPHKKKK